MYKVGVKTAAALLQEFESLEKLLAEPERIGKKVVRESVQNSLGQIQVNYQLIKLGNHAVRPFILEELVYQYDGKTTMQVLEGIGVR